MSWQSDIFAIVSSTCNFSIYLSIWNLLSQLETSWTSCCPSCCRPPAPRETLREREKSTHSQTLLTLHTYSEVSSPQFPPSPPQLNIWKWAGRCLYSSSSSCWWTWRQSRPPRTGGDSVWRSPRGERDITTPLLASHLGTDTELRGPDYDWRSYHFLITSARAVD